MNDRRCSGRAWLAGQSASINARKPLSKMVDNFAIQNAQVEVGWTVVTVLFRLGRQDKVHQLTQQNPPQKSAIISPFEMLKVETEWTAVAVLAGLGWLDKVQQITHQNLPQKIGDNFALQKDKG